MPRLDITLEAHAELFAEDVFRRVIRRITCRQNARQPPRPERIRNQSLPESRGIAAAMMSPGENPAEFDILRVQVAAHAESGETDRFLRGFQTDRPVAGPFA